MHMTLAPYPPSPIFLETDPDTWTLGTYIFFQALCPLPFCPLCHFPCSFFSSFAQLLAMNYVLYPYGVRKVSLGIAFPT